MRRSGDAETAAGGYGCTCTDRDHCNYDHNCLTASPLLQGLVTELSVSCQGSHHVAAVVGVTIYH